MFAVIELSGKQYKVQEGDIVYTEKLPSAEEGGSVVIDRVIAVSGDKGFLTGNPVIDGATVTAKVVKHGKSKKIYILKYKAKNNDMKRIGHRQPYTKLQIESIKA